ncbi:hypothetical protein U1Q18_046334 [Sarracenia purpurea var. burkii]
MLSSIEGYGIKKESGKPLAGFWNPTSANVFTPSSDVDSSQSLGKRSMIPSSVARMGMPGQTQARKQHCVD